MRLLSTTSSYRYLLLADPQHHTGPGLPLLPARIYTSTAVVQHQYGISSHLSLFTPLANALLLPHLERARGLGSGGGGLVSSSLGSTGIVLGLNAQPLLGVPLRPEKKTLMSRIYINIYTHPKYYMYTRYILRIYIYLVYETIQQQ